MAKDEEVRRLDTLCAELLQVISGWMMGSYARDEVVWALLQRMQQSDIGELCHRARRIIEVDWGNKGWPPDKDTVGVLMQLAVDLGRVTEPGWKPEGVNE